MPLKLTDATSNSVLITFSNDGNTEFGPATPNSPISFQGRPLLDGSNLAQNIARPPGMPRLTGSITIPAGSRTSGEISCPPCVGFGSVDGPGGVMRFNGTRTSFTIYANDTAGHTLNYSVW